MKKILILLLFFYFCNISCSQVRLEKSIVTPDNIKSIIKYEKFFSKNDSTLAPKDSMWFRYIPGKHKILFTAPHATAHIREKQIKEPDSGTGSLAVILNQLRKVPVLFTTYLSPSDPNYYDKNVFKKRLAQIVDSIKPMIVIDLHASNPVRPYDVDFGTMEGISYLDRKDLFDSLSIELNYNGLINQSLDFFAADINHTVTRFLHNKNVPCIQLEINYNFLSPARGDVNAQRTSQLLQALLRFIDDVDTLETLQDR